MSSSFNKLVYMCHTTCIVKVQGVVSPRKSNKLFPGRPGKAWHLLSEELVLELDFKEQEGIFQVRMGWEDIAGKGNSMYKSRRSIWASVDGV